MNTIYRIRFSYIVVDGADRTVGSFPTLWETLLAFPDARLLLAEEHDTILSEENIYATQQQDPEGSHRHA